MSDTAFALSLFGSLLAAATAGSLAAARLPRLLAAPASRSTLRGGLRLVAVLAALMLGMSLIALKGTFDEAGRNVEKLGVEISGLGVDLHQIGPAAEPARSLLQRYAQAEAHELFPHRFPPVAPAGAAEETEEALEEALERLAGGVPAVANARAMLYAITETRTAIAEAAGTAVTRWQISLFTIWLLTLFTGYGLISRRTPLAAGMLTLGAAAAAGAVFLLSELADPFHGLIIVSHRPLLIALQELAGP
jgi:hypothetical protein